MSVHRVMGVETEYGIIAPGHPDAASAQLSARILDAHVEAGRQVGHVEPVRWDYSGELADPGDRPERVARLTAQEQRWYRGSSLVLTNGGRLYIDHGHPEHCTPEVSTPQEVVRYDVAGDLMMTRALAHLAQTGAQPAIAVIKNNVDGKGAAYGSHENYLVRRDVPFDVLTAALVPFLVSRAVMCGSGRVGIGPRSEQAGYQIWQRADYVERVSGPETTSDRPIVNTRDEPHADPARWRRLHVICGDATCAQASTLLKVGATALILWVLERVGLPASWAALRLADPVTACRIISRDPDARATVPLADGRRLTAVQLQLSYLEVVEEQLSAAAADPAADPETEQMRALWRGTLQRLADDPWSCADTVEWVAKRVVLTGLAQRAGVGWDDPSLAAADLQWGDLRPRRGIAAMLTAQGRLRSIVDPAAATTALTDPPTTTRAWLRGEAIRRLGAGVFAASWRSLVLDTGEPSLVRLPMERPDGFCEAEAGQALAVALEQPESRQAHRLLAELTAGSPRQLDP